MSQTRCRCCGGSGIEPVAGATLLGTIVADFGTAEFTTADLMRHARLIDGAALRPALHGYSAKRLGKLLRSLEGHRVDDLRLERLGVERGKSVIWRVLPV